MVYYILWNPMKYKSKKLFPIQHTDSLTNRRAFFNNSLKKNHLILFPPSDGEGAPKAALMTILGFFIYYILIVKWKQNYFVNFQFWSIIKIQQYNIYNRHLMIIFFFGRRSHICIHLFLHFSYTFAALSLFYNLLHYIYTSDRERHDDDVTRLLSAHFYTYLYCNNLCAIAMNFNIYHIVDEKRHWQAKHFFIFI